MAGPAPEGNDGPVRSLNRAVELLAATAGEREGPVTVWLREGTYPLDRPVEIGPEIGCEVTFRAWPGERPVIAGGTVVGDWKTGSRGDTPVWFKDISSLIRNNGVVRSLFVDGERADRPRLPRTGFYEIADIPRVDPSVDIRTVKDRFIAAPGHIRQWSDLEDIELVVCHNWVEERLSIESFDAATNEVALAEPARMSLCRPFAEGFAKYYLDNVGEALEAGEWYLDRTTGVLYYAPMPGQSPEHTEVIIPHVSQLLLVRGAPEQDRFVGGLRFSGITFAFSDWDGSIRSAQAASRVPGAVLLQGTAQCGFEDCRFEHLGGYGLEIGNGCRDIGVVGCTFRDLGAGGIKAGGAPAHQDRRLHTGMLHITDNHIHDCGKVYHSGVGILVRHAYCNFIAHNEIHDLFYSGISCGWVWGYAENISRGNRIEKNHIHHLGKGVLDDMGGIYTLGVQPGTAIRGNLIHDIQQDTYGGWAIYPDEGSSHMVIENNVCYDAGSEAFHLHFGRENIVRNNIWAFGGEGMMGISRGNRLHWPQKRAFDDGGVSSMMTFERNIVITDGRAAWVGGLDDPCSRLELRPFLSDLNLYFDIRGGEIYCANGRHGQSGRDEYDRVFEWDEWRKLGYDRHSIVADPLCENIEDRNFTIRADSPALALGFEPIDTSDVGIRPPGSRACTADLRRDAPVEFDR